jgi:glycosyltransferase involved in cell wall biosynthesis
MAPCLLRHATAAGAKSILRISSDLDAVKPKSDLYCPQEILGAYRHLDRIVVQTEMQKELLQRESDMQSVWIPSIWPENSRPLVEKKIVLWVASSRLLKQPWFFLELAKKFPQEEFVMVMPKNEANLYEYIKEVTGKISNIRLIDTRISIEDTNRLFDSAKLFVNTSNREGFPNTFLQAGASSTPILSLGINPDSILTKYDMGVSARWDYAELVNLTQKILTDEKQRKIYGKNARSYVASTHCPNTIAKKWTHAILDIVEVS